MKILVSACLLGINCRYCGGGNFNDAVMELVNKYDIIPVCPEQMGGLSTPRQANEILNGRVIEKNGKDNTQAFVRGAEEVLKIAKLLNCYHAILKQRSPSCGSSIIYDGTFSSKKIAGKGITASLLMKNQIKVVNEENIKDLFTEE